MCNWVKRLLQHDNLVCLPSDIRPALLVPTHFDRDGMLRQKARLVAAPLPRLALECPLWAAGFSFSRAEVIYSLNLSMPSLMADTLTT